MIWSHLLTADNSNKIYKIHQINDLILSIKVRTRCKLYSYIYYILDFLDLMIKIISTIPINKISCIFKIKQVRIAIYK
jgi:hypothetical protein